MNDAMWQAILSGIAGTILTLLLGFWVVKAGGLAWFQQTIYDKQLTFLLDTAPHLHQLQFGAISVLVVKSADNSEVLTTKSRFSRAANSMFRSTLTADLLLPSQVARAYADVWGKAFALLHKAPPTFESTEDWKTASVLADKLFKSIERYIGLVRKYYKLDELSPEGPQLREYSAHMRTRTSRKL